MASCRSSGDGGLQIGSRRLRIGDAGTAENHHGGFDPLFLEGQLWFQQLKLQPHGPQLVSQEKIQVLESQPVAGRLAMGCFGFQKGLSGVLVGRGEKASAEAGASHDTFSLGSNFHVTSRNLLINPRCGRGTSLLE